MAESTRTLHHDIDEHIRRSDAPYLHPSDKTVQLDLIGSHAMIEWQESKVEMLFGGETCWSELPQIYGRYGTEAGRKLIARIRDLESAEAALLCDSGMQASAIVFDVLLEPGTHAVMFRQVYNKTEKYLSWIAERTGSEVTIIDDGDLEALAEAIRPTTRLVFAETYSNPLMRALDIEAVSRVVANARAVAPRIKLVVDTTIATPWGFASPPLSQGVDIVIASMSKAIGGQDRDLGGLIATNNIDVANAAMDLLAMRGGTLDWRRADAILAGLDSAKEAHQARCQSASRIATFLHTHPKVAEVFHPSLPSHIDAEAIAKSYRRHGSLLSFRLRDAGEEIARRFCDALATCLVVRYALSFDGLCTKVNHHKSVSEYFTPDESLRRSGINQLIRIGVGLENSEDICAALNWSLHHGVNLSEDEIRAWQRERAEGLAMHRANR